MNLRNSILFLGLVIILIGSSGIPVFEHHCAEDGVTYGVFTDVHHDCHDELEVESCHKSKELGCCDTSLSNSENLPSLKEKCCSTTIKIVKVQSEFTIHSFDYEIDYEQKSDQPEFNIPKIRVPRVFRDNKGPPYLCITNAQKRAFLQTYLI